MTMFLRPSAKKYTPPHRQDKTRYCEFHGDHGHDTNNCIDLRKEIEACIRNGRLSHLAKGARAQNNIQTSGPSGATDRGKNHVKEWPRKLNVEAKTGHEILMTSMRRSSPLINQKSQEKPTHEIAFSSHDPIPSHCNGDDPLVIKAYIGGTMIHRIYVDGGSSAEILYDHCFQQLSATLKETLQPPTTPLIGFAGQSLWPLGVITLPLTMYDYNGRGSKTIVVEFMVVQAPSPYNAILGRPGMKKLGAIASTIHALIKFPIQSGIATVRGDIPGSQKCFQISRKREHDPDTSSTFMQGRNKKEEGVIVNDDHPNQQVTIGAELPTRLKDQLRHMLRTNKDIFAWSPADMTGIPCHLAEHKLNIHPRTFPVKQKKYVLAKDRNIAVSEEVKKLVDARILKEAFFPRWISNPVMVQKSNGSWRMCIDFTNLNKACPKDSYPLPEIDQKIESLDGFRYKCFLDAYKGYHQIRMAKEDEENTSFHTKHGTFCYEKMPFGLKNVGATYQLGGQVFFETTRL
ncbi:hypothetical protein Tco_1404051 [Tanacetum coccineum]